MPPYLKPGDTIGIVSTASKIERDVVMPAVELLQNVGFDVRFGASVFAKHHQFAGSDTLRTADLQQMMDDKRVKAILCSRGGYGTLRTLQQLDWKKFETHPKWIIGFSDVTVLHSALNTKRIASLHGVMPKHFVESGQASHSFSTLLNALTGGENQYTAPASQYNIEGRAEAELVGGNLSILFSLRGTPFDIDTRGKILFIEDLAEYYYHIDRMMMNLKTGGVLSGLKGLIVGGFSGLLDNETPYGYTLQQIILDAIKEYQFPVAFDFPIGHQPDNFALKTGCVAKLEVSEQGTKFTQK